MQEVGGGGEVVFRRGAPLELEPKAGAAQGDRRAGVEQPAADDHRSGRETLAIVTELVSFERETVIFLGATVYFCLHIIWERKRENGTKVFCDVVLKVFNNNI